MSDRYFYIHIINNSLPQTAQIGFDSAASICRLKITFTDGSVISEEGDDYFACFAAIRRRTSAVIYLCKGAKINVFPSGMARQMARGLVAYQLTLGRQAMRSDIVNIFDFDDADDLAGSPDEQEAFFQRWLQSLLSPSS